MIFGANIYTVFIYLSCDHLICCISISLELFLICNTIRKILGLRSVLIKLTKLVNDLRFGDNECTSCYLI